MTNTLVMGPAPRSSNPQKPATPMACPSRLAPPTLPPRCSAQMRAPSHLNSTSCGEREGGRGEHQRLLMVITSLNVDDHPDDDNERARSGVLIHPGGHSNKSRTRQRRSPLPRLLRSGITACGCPHIHCAIAEL